jgi:hypothetical protein
MKRRKANFIERFLHRICLIKHVIEGKIKARLELKGIRRRRRNQLLDNLKEGIAS